MSWLKQKNILLHLAKCTEPKVKALHTTEHWFIKMLSFLVYLITLGGVSPEMWRAHTAISVSGHLFFPEQWPLDSVMVKVFHEARHTTQQKYAGLGSVWLGMIPWSLLYFIIPLPIGLAIGRCFLEIDAKKKEWEAMSYDEIIMDCYDLAKDLASVPYFWAMPKFITDRWCRYIASKVMIDRVRRINDKT